MCLVFSDMTGDTPDIQISCTLLNGKGHINSFASSFCDKIPKIEIGTPMDFGVYKTTNKKTGKDKGNIGIEQRGVNLTSPYWDPVAKERIGDKPKEKEVVKLGVKEGDYSEPTEFQLKIFNKFCQDLNAYWGNEDEVKTTKEVVPEEEVMPF